MTALKELSKAIWLHLYLKCPPVQLIENMQVSSADTQALKAHH